MKSIPLYTTVTIISIMYLSCSKEAFQDDRPAPESSKVITSDIQYVSGRVDGSSSMATWPVAVFPADVHAVKYQVKVLHSGKTYTWNAGSSSSGEYNVYPASNNMLDGKFYIGLGRTWCSDCNTVNPAWEKNYRNNIFTESSKLEITYYY